MERTPFVRRAQAASLRCAIVAAAPPTTLSLTLTCSLAVAQIESIFRCRCCCCCRRCRRRKPARQRLAVGPAMGAQAVPRALAQVVAAAGRTRKGASGPRLRRRDALAQLLPLARVCVFVCARTRLCPRSGHCDRAGGGSALRGGGGKIARTKIASVARARSGRPPLGAHLPNARACGRPTEWPRGRGGLTLTRPADVSERRVHSQPQRQLLPEQAS